MYINFFIIRIMAQFLGYKNKSAPGVCDTVPQTLAEERRNSSNQKLNVDDIYLRMHLHKYLMIFVAVYILLFFVKM